MSIIHRASTIALLAWASLSIAATDGQTSPRTQADAKAAALVAQLTLDEKVAQLLNVAPAIPRLGIPAYNWWTESLHGAIGTVPTTNFPEPIGLAATFDESLLREAASVISVEVRGLHALARRTGRLGRIGTGLDTWSPNINIFRDPRWGRGQRDSASHMSSACKVPIRNIRMSLLRRSITRFTAVPNRPGMKPTSSSRRTISRTPTCPRFARRSWKAARAPSCAHTTVSTVSLRAQAIRC
jgi:hypothetical protein